MNGWIRAYRITIKSRVFKNPELFQLWMWCLFKANHEDSWVSVDIGRGSTEVLVKRGTFIFGRNQAAKETGQKPTSLYKRMLKLENMQNLNIQSDTHYSIVTICNYDKYQNYYDEKEQAKEQPSDNQVTTKEQPSDTYNNVKNDKNDKKLKENIKRKNFVPPNVEDVSEYCRERNNGINPEQFIDFYTSKNWFIGKNKMKDWKAAVRTWERHQTERNNRYLTPAEKTRQTLDRMKREGRL